MRLEMDVELSLGTFRLRVDCRLDADVLGIFGPSGAGKTTLLHLVSGLLRPRRGRIVLDDEVLFDNASHAFVPAHRRRIGMVFQDSRLFPHLTVRGNLRFAQRLIRGKSSALPWDRLVTMLELDALLERKVEALSGGERQRVALGRALLSAPRLLLLDEPISSVDAGRRAHILPMLRAVARDLNVPMVVVSHELSQLLYLTDRLLLIENGRHIGCGPFAQLLHEPDALRLLRTSGVTNLLHLRADRHLPTEGITLCTLRESSRDGPARPLRGPLLRCTTGTELTATLRPEDIMLSLAPAEYLSAQNQMPGRVKEIIHDDDRTLSIVDVGTELLVDVTHYSATGLDLAGGREIWCLFKTHAIKYLFEDGKHDHLSRPNMTSIEAQTAKKAKTDSHESPFPSTRTF